MQMSRNQKRYSATSNCRDIIRNLNALYQTVELTGEKLDMLIQRLTQLQQALQNVV